MTQDPDASSKSSSKRIFAGNDTDSEPPSPKKPYQLLTASNPPAFFQLPGLSHFEFNEINDEAVNYNETTLSSAASAENEAAPEQEQGQPPDKTILDAQDDETSKEVDMISTKSQSLDIDDPSADEMPSLNGAKWGTCESREVCNLNSKLKDGEQHRVCASLQTSVRQLGPQSQPISDMVASVPEIEEVNREHTKATSLIRTGAAVADIDASTLRNIEPHSAAINGESIETLALEIRRFKLAEPSLVDNQEGSAEFEFGSSPSEDPSSDSRDSSSVSSSEEDSEEDQTHNPTKVTRRYLRDHGGSEYNSSDYEGFEEDELFDPAEVVARRLMQKYAGSEYNSSGDEGSGAARSDAESIESANAGTRDAPDSKPLRTKNEKLDEIFPKPDVTVTPDMDIQELGTVEKVVEDSILIKAKVSGEYEVLESGSVLCLGNRSVIGVIAETLGLVQQPYYTVRFPEVAAITEAGIVAGSLIFYLKERSKYVFTQPLKAIKGSDASNVHDEEVAENEVEFSDDEDEISHKQHLKRLRSQLKRDDREDNDTRDRLSRGPSRGRRGRRGQGRGDRRQNHQEFRHVKTESLNYDDNKDGDDMYTPLTRPANLHQIMAKGPPPPVEGYDKTSFQNGQSQNKSGRHHRKRGHSRDDGGRNRSRGAHRGRDDRREGGYKGDNGQHSDRPSYQPPSSHRQIHNGNRQYSPPQQQNFPHHPNNYSIPPSSSHDMLSYDQQPLHRRDSYPHNLYGQSPPNLYSQQLPQPSSSGYYSTQHHSSPPPLPPPPPPPQPVPQQHSPNFFNQQPFNGSSNFAPQLLPQNSPPQTPNFPPGAYINPAFFPTQSSSSPLAMPPWQPQYQHQQQNMTGGGNYGRGGEGGGRPATTAAGGGNTDLSAEFKAAQERLETLRRLMAAKGSGDGA
ncbi:MAG: hypothetical protein Q9214_002788 [Letrouitia sp. 1 TL-2023]